MASRTSSVPEVGGEACLYINPYDAADLAHALYRVLADAALQAALRARSLARGAEFTLERMGRDTLGVYRRVLEASG